MEIKLAALEPEDLELLYTIENSPALWSVGTSNVPYSRYALRDYIATQQHDIYADRQLRLVIRVVEDEGAEKLSSRAVGLIDLFNFDPMHQRAEMGIAILREEQGRGYAAEAVRQLADYSRCVLSLRQLYCVVPCSNNRSLNMLRKTGFCNENILKEWLKTADGMEDAIHMQLFL